MPDFSYEKKYWKQGFSYVFGIDEVGRGPLAGPVVAGAAVVKFKVQSSKSKIYKEEILSLEINDSKKLSPQKREILAKEIPKYFHIGIGQSSVAEINKLGIVKATEKAMERAIKNLFARNSKIQIKISKQIPNSNVQISQNVFILVDGFRLKHFIFKDFNNQEAIIKGDGKSISIASASIMAKVYRDRLMVKLSKKYPHYGWEKNKGYGTKLHMEKIKKYGATQHHRKLFLRGKGHGVGGKLFSLRTGECDLENINGVGL